MKRMWVMNIETGALLHHEQVSHGKNSDRDNDGQVDPDIGSLSVSAGYHHTCGLTTPSNVECWGSNLTGESSPPSGTFSTVSAGGAHTCGVKTSGSVECWGDDDSGQSTPPEL